MSSIIYSFREGLEELNRKLRVGFRYEFSDCLQREKCFFVEWQEGVLDKIERHPNSANCLVSNGRYFLYCREISEYNNIYDKIDYLVSNKLRFGHKLNEIKLILGLE